MDHDLQFEKLPTIVIALYGSSDQSVESKRFGALDFEVQGPTEMTTICFKTHQHSQLVLAFALGVAGAVSWHSDVHSIHQCVCHLYLNSQSFANLHMECQKWVFIVQNGVLLISITNVRNGLSLMKSILCQIYFNLKNVFKS